MQLVRISLTENIDLLKVFLKKAGDSLKKFRYFQKRPIESIKNHIITYIGMNECNQPICYGHLDKDNDKVWLGICVVDSERNKGFGAKMVDALVDYAYEKNIEQIILSVDDDNFAALNLYTKKGFRIIKTDNSINFLCKDLK